MPTENPLLSPSTLPYGLPDYSLIRPEHYLPAFEAAFAEHTQEVAAITRARVCTSSFTPASRAATLCGANGFGR